MQCARCGKLNSASASYCDRCGALLTAEASASGAAESATEGAGQRAPKDSKPPIRCARCGTNNPDWANYCARCGSPMTPGNILESAAPSGRGASRGGAAKPPPFPRAGIGPPTSGKATAALVLGLFSVFGCTALTGVPALICGILGLRDIKRKPGALKGGGIAIAGIALGAIGTLLVIPIIIAVSMRLPNFHPAQTRSKVARVTTDMRSMATAIEAYYIDNGAYPAWAFGPAGANGTVISSPPTASQPTFKIWANPSEVGSFNLLTTPISYIQRFREDPFVDTLGLGTPTYAYFTDGGGWMLLSPGPDGDYDVDPSAIYNSSDPNIASLLAPLTYDPSNGEISNGDIWRIKN